MNILMTVDAVGGVWTYAMELARSLEPYGIGFTIAAMGPRPTHAQLAEAALCANVTVHHRAFALEWMDDPWRDIDAAGHWLRQLVRRSSPDLIHLNAFVHGALDWKIPIVIVAHSCVGSRWRALRHGASPVHFDMYRERVKAAIQQADAVVAPTHDTVSAITDLYGSMNYATVIPYARDSSLFYEAPKEPFILAAGRLWDPVKNLFLLEAAAPGVSWPIHVAGEATSPTGEAANFSAIHPLGQLDSAALAQWYARAAIFAHPARYQPFGFAPLEAALSGCALVLADIPSLREVWADAALFVDSDDVQGWSDTLNALTEDVELRERLASCATDRALMYSPDQMAGAYLRLYSRVIRHPSERVSYAS